MSNELRPLLRRSGRQSNKRQREGDSEPSDVEDSDVEDDEEVHTVTVCNAEESNSVLFIFETCWAKKIFFNITPTGLYDFTKLKTKIAEHCDIPHNGQIVQLVELDDGFQVYMWEFKKCTRCSDANAKLFLRLKRSKDLDLENPIPISKGKISYPFFTLAQGKDLHEGDKYSSSAEVLRVNALMLSLQSNSYHVQIVASVHHYCPFSGGGDIFIENGATESLIFQSDVGDIGADGNLIVAENVSPTTRGTQKVAQLCLELKNEHVYLDEKKHQLWANMIILIVEKFAKSCCEKTFSRKDLIDVKTLTSYGILCCGNGGLAGYKLEIEFNASNHAITKIEPDIYNRLRAAKLIDLFIERFARKTDEWKNEQTNERTARSDIFS